MPSVFISYEYKDKDTKPIVENWKQQGLGVDISFISIPYFSNQPKLGKKKLRKKIFTEILKADIVMVLLSGNTHSKPWMLYEIRVAQCNKKKLFCCKASNIEPGLPSELKRVKNVPLDKKSVENIIRSFQSGSDKSTNIF
jgi:hypothetical protein